MLKDVGSIGRSVHWRSVKYPVIYLILNTTANKVHPYLSIRVSAVLDALAGRFIATTSYIRHVQMEFGGWGNVVFVVIQF